MLRKTSLVCLMVTYQVICVTGTTKRKAKCTFKVIALHLLQCYLVHV